MPDQLETLDPQRQQQAKEYARIGRRIATANQPKTWPTG